MKVAKILALVCAILFSVTIAEAKHKDIKEIIFKVEQMHTAKIEKEIIKSLKSAKGVESVGTNLKECTVKITYDADRTNATTLGNRLKKKYKIAPVLPSQPAPKQVEPKKVEPKKVETKKEETKKEDSRTQERTR